MRKSATISLRVDPEVKSSAEDVRSRLGLSMSTAVDMLLRQVSRAAKTNRPAAHALGVRPGQQPELAA